MKKKEYENLIYYSICEVLYDEMKNTNFSTYSNMCKTIKVNVLHGEPLSSEEYKLITKTMSEISFLYGLDNDNIIHFITNFLKNDKWELFIDVVVVLKTFSKNSYL